jgi:hypothetical protein
MAMTPEQLKTAIAGLTKRRDTLDKELIRSQNRRGAAVKKRDALIRDSFQFSFLDTEKRDAIMAEDKRAADAWYKQHQSIYEDWQQTVKELAKLQGISEIEAAGPGR